MTQGTEPVDIIDPWLYSTLSGDAEITRLVGDRISNGGALGPQAVPYITWDMNSSRDVAATVGGFALWNESLFEVKAIGQGGSYGSVVPVANRIQALLGEATNVLVVGKGIVTCRRDRVIRYVEFDDNVQYRHLGAIYRITAHSL